MSAWVQESAKKLRNTTQPLEKRIAKLEGSAIVRVLSASHHFSMLVVPTAV